MKKHLVIATCIALLLSGCSSLNTGRDDGSFEVSQSSVVSSVASAGWVTVNDKQFGLSFSHPSVWGQWSVRQIPSQPHTDALAEMSFFKLDSTIQYPHTGNADINVTLRKYDEDEYRYEEVCVSTVDLCDSMKQQDLLEEKETFIKQATQKIGGVPATIRDFYDVPSGYVARDVQLYTPTHRVHFSAIYDIGDFLITKGPDDASLYDTAKRLLGSELSDPINRLSTMYPEELQGMSTFYHDVDQLLESLRVRE